MTAQRACVLLAPATALAGAALNQTMPPLSQYTTIPKVEIAARAARLWIRSR